MTDKFRLQKLRMQDVPNSHTGGNESQHGTPENTMSHAQSQPQAPIEDAGMGFPSHGHDQPVVPIRGGQALEGNYGGVQVEGRLPPEMAKYINESMQSPQQHDQYQPAKVHTPPVRRKPGYVGIDEVTAKSAQDTIDRILNNYDEVTLPSLGRFYTNPILAQGVLHIRSMTGHDEEILATNRFVKKGQAMNMIFRNCLQEQIDPDELLTLDRNYLLIYLRGISYTENYEVSIRCPECGKSFPYETNLDHLPVEYCPEDFDSESLVTTLPATGFKVYYRLSTGADETKLAQHRDRMEKQSGVDTPDDTLIYRSSLLIDMIETTDGRTISGQMFIQSLIRKLPIKDVAHIRNTLNDVPFGVDTRVFVDCPNANCGNQFEATLPMEAGFFFPIQKRRMGVRA